MCSDVKLDVARRGARWAQCGSMWLELGAARCCSMLLNVALTRCWLSMCGSKVLGLDVAWARLQVLGFGAARCGLMLGFDVAQARCSSMCCKFRIKELRKLAWKFGWILQLVRPIQCAALVGNRFYGSGCESQLAMELHNVHIRWTARHYSATRPHPYGEDSDLLDVPVAPSECVAIECAIWALSLSSKWQH